MTSIPVIPDPEAAAPASTSGAAPSSAAQTSGIVADQANTEALKPAIVKALSTVFDPEIPVNIYELGLIYDIVVDSAKAVGIRMTLTAPACPAAQVLPGEVARKVREVPGVSDAKVDIVWDPPWTRDRMSDAAKLQLGMF
jgi:FeS assembly SUF system protein